MGIYHENGVSAIHLNTIDACEDKNNFISMFNDSFNYVLIHLLLLLSGILIFLFF